MIFSYFTGGIKNTTKPQDSTLDQAIHIIKTNGKIAKAVELIRAATDKKVVGVLKQNLPYFTFAATYKTRKLGEEKALSGLMVIDLDQYEKIDKKEVLNIPDLPFLRSVIIEDKHTLVCFTSPSGKGLKILVKVDPKKYGETFDYLKNYYLQTFNVHIDPSGRDISRACFASHDPEIYYNPAAEPVTVRSAPVSFTEMMQTEGGPEIIAQIAPADTAPLPDSTDAEPDGTNNEQPTTNNDVLSPKLAKDLIRAEFCVDQIEFQQIDITQGYKEWLEIGLCLSLFGEKGRGLFHRVSAQSSAYKHAETDAKFNHILATRRESFTNPAKFFAICRDNDIITKAPKKVPSPNDQRSTINDQRKEKQPNVVKEYTFHKEVYNPNLEKTEIQIQHLNLVEFLGDMGFGRFPINDEKKDYQLVHVENKIIDYTTDTVMFDATMDYLAAPEQRPVKSKILSGAKTYFAPHILRGLPWYSEVEFLKDTETEAHVFYQNGYVTLRKDSEPEFNDYTHLKKHIWRSARINRTIKLVDSEQYSECDYAKFISMVAVGRHHDELKLYTSTDESKKIISIASALGYLTHGYKNPAYSPAVIGVDAKVSHEKNPNGRTGKGLIGKGVGQMIKTLPIDSRNFNFNNPHAFSGVKLDTRAICFNDCPAKFPFDRLFNPIAEDMDINPKNRDSFIIPFDQSPKIYVNTNFVIRGDGSSNIDRQFIIEASEFFSETVKPIHIFGRPFFTRWDAAEYNLFDNYMIFCIQTFLDMGLVPFPTANYELRILMDKVRPEGLDFFSELRINESYDKDKKDMFGNSDLITYEKHELFAKFLHENPDFGKMAPNTFTKWMNAWAAFNNYEINPHLAPGQTRDKRGDKEFITIFKKAVG